MRTIIIGDVHGCATELAALLDRLGPTTDDQVIMVGDLVVRGPDPLGVLSLVRQIGAQVVRGNHEARLLRWRAAHRAQTGGTGSGLAGSEARLLKAKWLTQTAEQIDPEGWALIESLPLWIDLPAHDLRVVHAGLEPGVPLADQAERHLLTIRTVDQAGRPSDRREGGQRWGACYEGPPQVVFGHNADFKPQLHPWATGIDTGCVYGGALTALVLPAGEPVPELARRADALVTIPARQSYYPVD
jgi:hypothetical protein